MVYKCFSSRKHILLGTTFIYNNLNDFENVIKYGIEAYKMKNSGKCCLKVNDGLQQNQEFSYQNQLLQVLCRAFLSMKKYDEAIEFCKKKLKFGLRNGRQNQGYILEDYADLIKALICNKSWELALETIDKINFYNLSCTDPEGWSIENPDKIQIFRNTFEKVEKFEKIRKI